MNDVIETSERLTRERFHELLQAYCGAMDHAAWLVIRKGSENDEYRIARDAAAKALNDLEQAVGV